MHVGRSQLEVIRWTRPSSAWMGGWPFLDGPPMGVAISSFGCCISNFTQFWWDFGGCPFFASPPKNSLWLTGEEYVFHTAPAHFRKMAAYLCGSLSCRRVGEWPLSSMSAVCFSWVVWMGFTIIYVIMYNIYIYINIYTYILAYIYTYIYILIYVI